MALAFRSVMLRRILLLSLGPLLYYAPVFFAIGYVTDPDHKRLDDTPLYGMVAGLFGPEVGMRISEAPDAVRPAAWSIMFHSFFSLPQAIFMMLVVAIVGPALISQDVRSKAFLLYFSKPITRVEYLAGKAWTLLLFLALQILAPALALYVISILFSPSAVALVQTSQTILRIVEVFLVMAVPTTFIMLCFSSLARESRYPAFGWMAFCVVGEISYAILRNMSDFKDSPWVCCLSLRKTINVMTESIFGVPKQLTDLGVRLDVRSFFQDVGSPYSPSLCLAWLAAVSIGAFLITYRRISAPIRL
jgi:hypothetical protein